MSIESEIQQVLQNREDWIDVSVGAALGDLAAFLLSVQQNGFSATYRRISGDYTNRVDAIGAVNGVAEKIGQDLHPLSAALFGKALQEALLDICDVRYDLELEDVELRLKNFLAHTKRSKFIELVLSLYLFYSMWIPMQDEMRGDCENEEAFEKITSVIQGLSRTAISAVIKESIATRELDRAGASPDTGVRIMKRLKNHVLGATSA